jgi:Icc-related predicted phosphoesterase
MKILSISDPHGRLGPLDRLEPWLGDADVVILAGDVTNFGHADDALRIIEPLKSRARRLLAVSGNCDYPDVVEALASSGISLESGATSIDDVTFVGLGGSLPGPAPTPNVFSEQDLAESLSRAAKRLTPSEPWLLVSHQPPRDTAADRTGAGQHVGSTAVRDFILDHQPLICFTAHIHESRGLSRLGQTYVVNPGPVGRGSVAVAEIESGDVVDCRIQPLD